ncbi:MAG TPA: ATP-binding protein [Anaerolineales bacterium]|nr:ATP-binding protein [Anaerolineales bacterium]
MKMWLWIRRQLGIKLFLSYLIVVVLGIIVLATAVEFTVPNAFNRHLATMTHMMGQEAGPMEQDLFENFRQAVNESLAIATVAAGLSAILISFLISRQVTGPIRAVQSASQRIADGHYTERVQLTHMTPGEADELGQLAVSFNQMAAHLEQTESLRRELIGDVAHELRTPLTTIKGTVEALLDGVLPPEAETFQQIYREADRLQRLVADLQELSRVEAGAYKLHPQPLSLAEVCATIADRLAHQFAEKGVAVSIQIPPTLSKIQADEDRLTQVLTNLIGNALQYTPRGGHVTIMAHQTGQEIRVAVQDDGIGIPAEALPHLFDRFYRVDKSRSRAGGGSGIGLTIAKHFVEAHGGRIWAESDGPGKGSTFSFTLPAST